MVLSAETAFLGTAEEFLSLVRKERAGSVEDITCRAPALASPVIIGDYRFLTTSEKAAISEQYHHRGLAHFIVKNPDDLSAFPHPLFEIAAQLADDLNLYYPLAHPLEGHPEAVKRFGPADSTVKIYNLPKPVGGASYREVAESNDAFDVHLDGLGSGGAVQSVMLYMDQAPLFGGFTFFYDMLALGAELAKRDWEAFESLFLPNAFTAVRPRGKGAIKVVTPVFYINEYGQPQVFYRKNSGEYRMIWREGSALKRARNFLARYTDPFSPGSTFVPFTRRGCACISRNRDIAHGRTAFIDGDTSLNRRVLSRKWFMKSAKDAIYKHVPGIAIRSDLAAALPERFGPSQLQGEWLFDAAADVNNRTK